MIDNQSLRQSILKQSNILGTKRRFGLFSQPISNAIGDNGAYKSVLHPKNQKGKPLTELRNIFVTPTKSGQLDNSYFSGMNSLASSQRKDIFLEEGIRLMKERNQSFNKGRKETNFFPISGTKPITNSAYKYKDEQNPQMDPKRFRQANGRVKSDLRNFYSNPQSQVISTNFKAYKHMDDPYDRQHLLELERSKKQKAKQHEFAFRPCSFTSRLINDSKKVYSQDVQLKMVQYFVKQHESKPLKLNSYPHENNWKPGSPNRQGIYGYLAPFPKYIQSPPNQTKRSIIIKVENQPFKKMSATSSTPSPSITLKHANLMGCVNRSQKQR